MQGKNKFELAMEEIIKRADKLSGLMTMSFEKKKPFDQPEISPKEQYYYYRTQFTPEMDQMSRQEYGDEMIDEYKLKMDKIGGRYGG